MKLFRHLFISPILVVGCVTNAHAFDRCHHFWPEDLGLIELIESDVVFDVPPERLELAKSIEVRLDPLNRQISPNAVLTAAGSRIINIPSLFPQLFCQFTLAAALTPARAEIDDSVSEMHLCFRNGNPRAKCYMNLGDSLSSRLSDSFKSIDAAKQDILYDLAWHGLLQISAHEIAHHVESHFERISDGLPILDAEFDADFNSAVRAINERRNPAGAAYFFQILSAAQQSVESANSNYEAAICRYDNLVQIAVRLAFRSTILHHMSNNTRYVDKNELIATFDTLHRSLDEPVEASSVADCSLSKDEFFVLINRDFVSLFQIFATYKGTLAAAYERGGLRQPLFGPEGARAIGDLMKVMDRLEVSHALAAGLLSSVYLRAAETDGIVITAELERRVDTKLRRYGSSKSYGRFLMANILRNDLVTDPEKLGFEETYDALREAYKYHPENAEILANLFLLSMNADHCRAAVYYGERAIAHTNNSIWNDMTRVLFEIAKARYSDNDPTCDNSILP